MFEKINLNKTTTTQVTPVYMLDQFSIDWYHYLCIWEGLTSDLKRVGEVVGVQDRFISKAVGGKFVATGDRSEFEV